VGFSERRNSAQLLDLRNRLAQALLSQAPGATVAEDRILEHGFFESPRTPTPARVIELPTSRLRTR